LYDSFFFFTRILINLDVNVNMLSFKLVNFVLSRLLCFIYMYFTYIYIAKKFLTFKTIIRPLLSIFIFQFFFSLFIVFFSYRFFSLYSCLTTQILYITLFFFKKNIYYYLISSRSILLYYMPRMLPLIKK
jgi:hypothetical protein